VADVQDLVTIVFLPLYFTYSGLRTKLEDLNTTESGIMVILILAASNIGKIGGATFAARLVGHTCRESLTVGVLLNTKGLVELIVLNIGLDVGILTEEMFASFIVMALFNTFITTPLTYLLWTRWAVRNDPNLRPK
jgi:Kef-type K+ transport system membrane component KefB